MARRQQLVARCVFRSSFVRNFFYQPFIRPFKYLRRKPRYEELHPEDEVTLPRNNMAVGGDRVPRRKRTTRTPRPRKRWLVPQVNRHALRSRATVPVSADHEGLEFEPPAGRVGLPLADTSR